MRTGQPYCFCLPSIAIQCVTVTDSDTPQFTLRIRLKRMPPRGEFDEFDLERFKAGQTYVVPARLASMLIIAGHADLIDSHPARAEAADFGQPKFPRRK